MRKLAVLLSLALLSGGCSSKETSSNEVTTETERAETAAVPATQTAPAEGEITLTGNMGCGNCTFKTGDECTAAIKTADGVVYLLDGVEEESELFTERKSGKEIRVVGVPREEEGVRYLAVKSYEM
jgi:hypothetical protein